MYAFFFVECVLMALATIIINWNLRVKFSVFALFKIIIFLLLLLLSVCPTQERQFGVLFDLIIHHRNADWPFRKRSRSLLRGG